MFDVKELLFIDALTFIPGETQELRSIRPNSAEFIPEYPSSRGPSIFLDKSAYQGRSKGLCSQGIPGQVIFTILLQVEVKH